MVVLFSSSIFAESIVVDGFESYNNGSVVGQGDWESYRSGDNFIVQGATVFEGTNALYNKSSDDSVIGNREF